MLDLVCTVPGRPASSMAMRLGVGQDLQRAVVAGPLADGLLEPLDGLDVVVEDVRRGLHDRAQRRVEVVGDEDLDTGVRAQAAQLADGRREGAGAAVGQVVAADAGDDDVLEAHDGDGLGDAARLVGVVPVRAAGLDGAEAAGPGAGVAEDHDGRRALLPALADVRAAGLLADGVERLAAHEVLELRVVGAAGQPGLDPLGVAAHVRPAQPGGVHRAAHGDGQRLEGVTCAVAAGGAAGRL